MVRKRKICVPVLRFLACAAAFVCTAALLVPPLPERIRAEAGYRADWADGTHTLEPLASVSELLEDCTAEKILLRKGGLSGSMAVSSAFSERFSLLWEGSLAELLAAPYPTFSPPESLALWRKFGNTGYYSEEFFSYDGGGFFRTHRTHFKEVVLMTGDISSEVLGLSRAETLTVRAEAQPTGDALLGTRIKEFRTFAPFYSENGALYLSTLGGTRLVAALPLAENLTVSEGIHFCDEGALRACTRLTSLTVPFVGSSVSPDGTDYDGRLQYMFAEYVPGSLLRVKVTGGALKTFAFEGCPHLREIDLCGIAWTEISRDAFVGCYGLEKLHTSLKNPNLAGNFRVSRLPCGCYLYEREIT